MALSFGPAVGCAQSAPTTGSTPEQSRIELRLPGTPQAIYPLVLAAFVAESLTVTSASAESGVLQSTLEQSSLGFVISATLTANVVALAGDSSLVVLSGTYRSSDSGSVTRGLTGTTAGAKAFPITSKTHKPLWGKLESVARRLR
jgi:hypothetical protein